jgi:heme-degrading monooxygenase HmoA
MWREAPSLDLIMEPCGVGSERVRIARAVANPAFCRPIPRIYRVWPSWRYLKRPLRKYGFEDTASSIEKYSPKFRRAAALDPTYNGLPFLELPMSIARTPEPPYYAVIFTSLRTEGDDGYGQMADRMVELASQQPGYLGVESAREGLGITVSYWASLEAIANWKTQARHLVAQRLGKEKWYAAFQLRVCRVERDYGFERE